MKVIKKDESLRKENSSNCINNEYSFGDNDIDLCTSKITGRYPESGYCLNKISKELIYIVSGSGKIVFTDREVKYKKGDSILIYPNEKYFWDSKNSDVIITCTPAWSITQYEVVDE